MCDFDESEGLAVDRRGHLYANGVDHTARHNGVMRRTAKMLGAVAIGQVVLGDKSKEEATAELNAGHVVDVAELEGDEDSGGDSLVEIKVPSPTTKAWSRGRGKADTGGCAASVGHLYAFGNTEEALTRTILGVRARGRKRDGPFNHATGRGWVKAHAGDYYDAIVKKKSAVTPFIVETSGALAPRAVGYVSRLSRRARGPGARDGTKYGRSRTSARSFFVHHSQQLSSAAAIGHVQGMHKKITSRKQAAHAARGSTAGATRASAF